ncbi:MAG TPA: DNA/RNA non-specific endonuclease [Lactobacillaceae bacterium]|jgi:DNA-entry nuclease
MAKKKTLTATLIALAIAAAGAYLNNAQSPAQSTPTTQVSTTATQDQDLLKLKWDGNIAHIAVKVNQNQATFTSAQLKQDLNKDTWMATQHLDALGRTLGAEALISKTGIYETKAVERPDFVRTMQPSGWFLNSTYNASQQEWRRTKSNNRPIYLDGEQKTVYSRGHLIGWQLGGGYHWIGSKNGYYRDSQLTQENQRDANGWQANMTTNNLTTSTMDQNDPGMNNYEQQIAAFVKTTGKHVRYRVTPIYQGNELVPRGNHLEAKSVEDNGSGLNLNLYIFNAMRDTRIDYATGQTYQEGE